MIYHRKTIGRKAFANNLRVRAITSRIPSRPSSANAAYRLGYKRALQDVAAYLNTGVWRV